MRIEVKNLTYKYGEKTAFEVTALNKVSLTVDEGEYLCVVGHTGSGKSTFIQHLNGLIRMQKGEGSIKIGEFDLADKKCDLKALRSKIGMLFQYPEYQLFADTVEKDVKFGLDNFSDISEEEKKVKVKKAITTVGLDYDSIKDRSPFELSGGQRRRVAIAGVIVTRPEILVLDEPVAGLDPAGKTDLLDFIDRVRADFVKTVIFVTHDMNIVSEKATRVAVFDKGSIKYDLLPKQLFKKPAELREIGLDVPVTAYLAEQMKKAYGVELDTDFTMHDFAQKAAEFFKK